MAQMETGYSSGAGRRYYDENGPREREGAPGPFEEISGTTRRKVMAKLDEQKHVLCPGLDQLASSLEQVGEGPQKQLASSAAGYLRRARHVLGDRSSEELLARARDEIRGRPGAVIAGAFLLGLLGARLLKR